MKTESSNPWPLIRWMTVAVVFGLTIGIAWDQVKTRDKDLASSAKDLAALRSQVADLKKVQRENTKLVEQVASLTQQNDLGARVQMRLARQVVDLQPQATAAVETAPASYVTASNYVPRVVEPPPINIPAWSPPAPSVVTKTIRDNAVAEHKTDYSGLNYEIERQTEAYEKILRYYKTADPFIKGLINKAALDHGSDYSAISYEIEREIEARQKFQGK